jgi:hypothetical protein
MPNDFMPDGYEAPKPNYSKMEVGDNRFRIMSKPIVGWEDWKDNKPLRYRMPNKPPFPVDPEKPIKHFWAMIVFDYQMKKPSVLEITQVGIQRTIETLAHNEDWGSPLNYDIVIKKSGSGMKTEYEVTPIPPKPVPEEISNMFMGLNINLEALFDGKDPFATPF